MTDGHAERRVVEILHSHPPFLDHLRHARSLGLASWCLGGGALRAVVWARLTARPVPPARDLDLAYFEPDDLSPDTEARLEARLQLLDPGAPWEVRNQARMHLWHRDRTGQDVPQVADLADGLATWPESATAVGAWLDGHDQIHLVAPLGLSDLLDMTVRPNLRRISAEDWRIRAVTKRWADRWPEVRLLAPDVSSRGTP
jgi:hypothetical protein